MLGYERIKPMFDPKRKTVVLIDLSVAMHQLEENLQYMPISNLCQMLNAGGQYTEREAELMVLKQIIKLNMDWLYSLDWLVELKPEQFKVLLLRDWKHVMRLSKDTHAETMAGWDIGGEFHDLWGYWRHEYLLRLENAQLLDAAKEAKKKRQRKTPTKPKPAKGVAYKAGRAHASNNLSYIKQKTQVISEELDWFSIGFPGYEADDLAGAIVHLNAQKDNPDQVLLVTTDTDWLGLVDSKHVSWFCMFGHYPRLRDTPELIADWSKRRLSVECRTGAQIFEVKSVKGDATDKLPGGCPEVISKVVDLLNPPDEFKLWNRGYCADLKAALDRPFNRVETANEALEIMQSVGIKPFIRPYQPSKDAPKEFLGDCPSNLFDYEVL